LSSPRWAASTRVFFWVTHGPSSLGADQNSRRVRRQASARGAGRTHAEARRRLGSDVR
jgi:hypothetical protein